MVIPSGDATLVITGTVGTSGGIVDIGRITIENLPMPGANDIDDMKELVREQYKDSGLTGDITVTLISSSSSSIVYNIKFNGSFSQSGFTFVQLYNLTFTYTK